MLERFDDILDDASSSQLQVGNFVRSEPNPCIAALFTFKLRDWNY